MLSFNHIHQSISARIVLIRHWDISLPGFIDKGPRHAQTADHVLDHVTVELLFFTHHPTHSQEGMCLLSVHTHHSGRVSIPFLLCQQSILWLLPCLQCYWLLLPVFGFLLSAVGHVQAIT